MKEVKIGRLGFSIYLFVTEESFKKSENILVDRRRTKTIDVNASLNDFNMIVDAMRNLASSYKDWFREFEEANEAFALVGKESIPCEGNGGWCCIE
ncbi:hypothetical protein L1987_86102 [Smallanthus sonchifolius]|uniref:Uncharacterized protein n=1 Tax=Smallanthus sonchifolius TaxID=185202 RepID=A0ACB8XZ55_9ASTR|nr:hypothetical protein L1987_86102 [Smallanthus sonchifolius]